MGVFLTEMDVLKKNLLLKRGMTEEEILRDLIRQDLVNPAKQRMAEGERYYGAEHDILQKDFRQDFISETEMSELDGSEREVLRRFENPNRSNYRVVNAFHRVLVDQKAYYLVSREPGMRVKGAEKDASLQLYEAAVADFMDESFNEMLQELVVHASNHGLAVLHPYYDAEGKFCYSLVPAMEVIPVYDTSHEAELVELIRYYTVSVMQDGRMVPRRRAEWWTKQDVTYYMETEPEHYEKEWVDGYRVSPHWWEVRKNRRGKVVRLAHTWGRVPFIILKNNRQMKTDLEFVKGLIDAYDLIASDGVNNFADLVELYWVIAGYGGETASAIARKLRVNRAVSISDAGGKIEARQTELPVMGRIEFLKLLRRDIFHFGMGLDTTADLMGENRLSAPSGVSLKFQYTQLDLKASGLASRLKRAMKELLWYFTQDYNALHGTDCDARRISVNLNVNRITDDTEMVQMIRESAELVSRKTLLGRHPLVDDVNAELQELRAQEAESGFVMGTDVKQA